MIPLAEALAIHHPVFAPDLPGFGLSDKPGHVLDLRELASALGKWMDAMDLPRAVMVANSLGCQVVTQLAVTQPDRVVAAILQGPTTDPEARSILVQFGRLLIDALREPLSLHPLVVRDYLKAGIRRNLQTLRYGLQDPIEERLSRMPVPTLIVRGARDPLVPQRWAERAAELLPHGRLIVLPGAAHAINYAQPKELARVIRDFLAHTVKSRSR